MKSATLLPTGDMLLDLAVDRVVQGTARQAGLQHLCRNCIGEVLLRHLGEVVPQVAGRGTDVRGEEVPAAEALADHPSSPSSLSRSLVECPSSR